MENGFSKTSISDIVNQAGVAKGTFYLYFTDKYDLRNKLISHKAIQVFSNAYNALLNTEIKTFEEQIIFIIDHILTQFQEDHSLVFFISKHLSWALFKNSLTMYRRKVRKASMTSIASFWKNPGCILKIRRS